MIFSYLKILLVGFGLFGQDAPGAVHELKMSICEMQQAPGGHLEIRFYLFQDDFKQALYGNPDAPKIDVADAKKYISQNTQLSLNGIPADLQFQSLDYRQDQVRLTYQVTLAPNQPIKKIGLTDRLLIELFRTQTNMVYFVKPDGEKLVRMLDAARTEAAFSL